MQPRIKRPPADELRKLYTDERLTTRQLGTHYGVSPMSIKRWLRRYEIPPRTADRGLRNRGIVAPTADELRQMVHEQHLSYQQIGSQYGVDHSAVQYWLKKHDIPRPTIWGTRRKGRVINLPTKAQLRAQYEAGWPLTRIARMHGVGARMISDLCREYGIAVRPDGWQGGRRWSCQDGHEVRSAYEQRVDDWLAEHELPHELEPRLPFDRRFRADFLVGDTYVEVWGVVGSATYDERKRTKVMLYRQRGLPLIELPAWTFGQGTWRRRLAPLLAEGIG